MLYLLAAVVLIAWLGVIYNVVSRLRSGGARLRRGRRGAADPGNRSSAYFDSGGHVGHGELTRGLDDHGGGECGSADAGDGGGDGGGGDGGGGD